MLKISKIYLSFILICPFFSCDTETSVDLMDQAGIVKDDINQITKNDSITNDTLVVLIQKNLVTDSKKLNIKWCPRINPYGPFVQEYMTELMTEMNSNIPYEMDSIVFETQIGTLDTALKTYSATRGEFNQLRINQKERNQKYRELIHFVASNQLIYAVHYYDLYFDRSMEVFLGKSDRLERGFLSYMEEMYDNIENPEKKEDELYVLKGFVADGVVWHQYRGPYDLMNYVLESIDENPLNFELSDTLEYGINPAWFDDVGVK